MFGFDLIAVIVLVLAAVLAFEVFMFLDVLKNSKLSDTEKIIWVIGMFLVHPVIAIVYYFVAHTRLTRS